MKTDRELLEAAAKSAGIKIDKSPYNGGGHGNTGFDVMGNAVLDWHNGTKWNPLTDDGDALRLAVKLHIDFKAYENSVRTLAIDAKSQRIIASIEVAIDDDPCAATRRAIVRAAASLQETK